MSALGRHFDSISDHAAALASFERALSINEKLGDAAARSLSHHLNNIGRMHRLMGDLPGARAAYERAVQVCISVYGPDHPNTKTVEKNLAALGKSRTWADRILGRE